MDDTGAPKLDPRSHDDVIAQTEALATAYTADATNGPWRPTVPGSDDKPDLGSALIRLFAGMVDHLIGQLNQVADKHRRAFTNLIAARRIPPRPARVPVTFTLATGAAADVVPERAQIAGSGPDGPVVFETEVALPLIRARLAAAFVRDVSGAGYANRTAIATGTMPGSFAALGDGGPIEHELYVAADELLAVPGVQSLTVVLDAGTSTLPTPAISWITRLATGGPHSTDVTPTGHQWTAVIDPSFITAFTASGVKRRWLTALVPAYSTPPPVMKVTTSVNFAVDHKIQIDPTAPPDQLVTFDAAFSNGQPVDFTRHILPFGDRPKFNDTFYFASDAGFAFAGTTVTLHITLTTSPNVIGTNAPVLTWEMWDGQTASSLTVTDTTNVLRAHGAITFTLPTAVPRSTIGAVTSRWLRVRLTGGDYGKDVHLDGTTLVPADLHPPSFAAATLTWTGNSLALPPTTLVRRTAMTFTWLTKNASEFVSIHRAGPELESGDTLETRSSLQLGFERAFEPRLTTIYIQVSPPPSPDPASFGALPPARNPPRLVWEYWNGAAWAPLLVEDGTQGLSRSGLVRFLPPAGIKPLTQFGRTLRWLRIRALDLVFSPMPRVGLVLLNTVFAEHAHITTLEVLGASSGARDQQFTLSQRPVLEGQRIEVGEPEPPRAAELAALQAVEGSDVLAPDPIAGFTWVRWHEVPDFLGSGPRDRHYTFDAETGVVTFGDGAAGMIPPSGVQNIRAALYRTGGGTAGNVSAGVLNQLKTTVTGVDRVTSRETAVGGASIESETAMLARAAHTLRHGGRAVTADDFVDLALESSRAVARAAVLTPAFSPIGQHDGAHLDALQRDGQVIVVIVPSAVQPGLAPSIDLCAEVEDFLRARAAPDARITVIGPSWVAADIVIHVAATSIERSDALRAVVRDAIAGLLDPLTGGDGNGWQFGRRPRASDVVARVAGLPDLDHVSSVSVTCQAPFDVVAPVDETDPLQLHDRLLVYAHSITVTAS